MTGLFIELFEEPLDIEWSTQGDLLIHHMWRLLDARIASTGNMFTRHEPTPDEPFLAYEYTPQSSTLRSALLLVPGTDGMHAFVRIESAEDVPDQVHPWAEALLEAFQSLDAPHPEYRWWAVVGPGADQLHAQVSIVAPAEVGPIRVHESFVYIDAYEQRDHPSLSGVTVNATYPAIVEGRARGYDWFAASRIAARDLNRICALFSVAFDAGWRVRQAPGPDPLEVEYLPKARLSHLESTVSDTWLRTDATVPDWSRNVWERLDADDALSTALHAHHQALLLEPVFPSHALLAYVGAVEGLGARLCPKETGAKQRFKKALARVLPDDECDALLAAYKQRSATAHEGRLHGGETGIGAVGGLEVFAPRSAASDFRYDVVWRMRAASRRLLLSILDQDPAPPL
jgi:hypothetical protein